MNTLWYGDCLTVMQGMPVGSVDLIYLDPPFNSSRNYHAIYQDETGRPLPDQIEAFCDMWTLTEEREREIRNMPILVRDTGIPDDVAEFWRVWMGALRKTNPALLAYLSYMVIRLAHMRVLCGRLGACTCTATRPRAITSRLSACGESRGSGLAPARSSPYTERPWQWARDRRRARRRRCGWTRRTFRRATGILTSSG